MASRRTEKTKAKSVRQSRRRSPKSSRKQARKTMQGRSSPEWDDDEAGYCGNCRYCEGVDGRKGICAIDDPHQDWRYRDNERCPSWEPWGWEW